jgi:peptide/nickel transport system substrate-binding protein
VLPPRPTRLFAVLTALAVSISGCTGTTAPVAPGDPDDGTAMVLGVPDEPDSLNPLAGYAPGGAAKIYDGLLEHDASLGVGPALAAGMPKPSPDGRSWTINLREGVRFTNGTALDSGDVAATYRALLDPGFASPLRARYSMLTGVRALDSDTVRFDLGHPYAPFPELLVLGIMPREALATPAPVTAREPEFRPVGTGPYELVEWRRGERMVFKSNRFYFAGAPAVTSLTVEFVADEETLARRIREGRYDGAALPPGRAAEFDSSEFVVRTHRSADLRVVRLPREHPVTADPAVRLALNHGVNRDKMVAGPLAGTGSPAYTPMPPSHAEYVEPSARFPQDLARARRVLEESGWLAAPDGTRSRAGVPARFTLRYPAGDSVSRELAESFVVDAKELGVVVTAQPTDPAEVARPGPDAVLVTTGDPFDPDLSLYPLLRPDGGDRAGPSPELDSYLDAGRTIPDPAQRAAVYRKLQRSYVDRPTMVALVAVDHTYVLRDQWTGYQAVVDTPGQGITWGPWWNLHQWLP